LGGLFQDEDVIFAALIIRLNFALSYPSWFVLLCLAAGALFSVLLYARQKNRFPSPLMYYGLMAIRFLVVSILAFLLLSPILKYLTNKEEKPTIVFLQDGSASLKHAFKKTDSTAYKKNVLALLEELQEDFIVKTFTFGNDLNDTLGFTYTDQQTDLSGTLETVMTTLESENLCGVVMATDGIYNKGASPLSMNYPFKGVIYSVGLGDTSTQRDALVSRVFANKLVYLGDQFAIRSDIAVFGAKGSQLNVTVFSHNANRAISSQTIQVGSDRFARSIETVINANAPGVQRYTITVSKLEGEQNIVNNTQDVYVEVIDSKEQILIAANAPHPDVFALREALQKNKNYKVTVKTADKLDANLSDYNLVILHNLPSANFNAGNLLDQAKRLGTSLWFIVGQQTAIQLLNQAQNALQISSRGLVANDAQGILNTDFSYFNIDPSKSVSSLPPLSSPLGDYKTGPNAQVLMYQKIGGITTQYPLIMMQQSAQNRIGIIAGEGLWRWRLYAYSQQQNHNLVDDYILKTAQFLSVKMDKKKFRVSLSKNLFTESEPLTFDAELYNDNFELINTPDVNLNLIDAEGKKYTYTLNKNGNSYSLNVGNLAEGSYSYSASTAFNGKSYSASGNFVVVAQQIEEVNTTADFGLLNQLATNYGGELIYPNGINSIAEKLRKHPDVKSILRSSIHTDPLIDWKWLFALLILLLGIEWFIRKHSGNY
jgi:hypothetical protein